MYKSSNITVGNVSIGSDSPIRIQSMTNTNTLNTEATVNQVLQLVEVGSELVRITTRSISEARNIKLIKDELRLLGINVPIIADVHYSPTIAMVAAEVADKIRINPGNFSGSNQSVDSNLLPLLKICKENNTAIRVGVNQGSLSETILYKYGNTPKGMVESLLEFVRICKANSFYNLILSVKASNVLTTIEANLLLIDCLEKEGLNYPIHLGVTEAGSDIEGRIKSASGIGYLLACGIGDTIRVSLSENPVEELPVARLLAKYYGNRINILDKNSFEIVKIKKESENLVFPLVVTSSFSEMSDYSSLDLVVDSNEKDANSYNILKVRYSGIPYDELIIKASTDITIANYRKKYDGIWIDNDRNTTCDQNANLSLGILQVLGLRISSTEYIACPTCGRSSDGLMDLLNEVKEKTSNLSGLVIAVMGCSVNGLGEMAGSDYGIVGMGNSRVNIYHRTNLIIKNIDIEMATTALINLIIDNGEWVQ